MTRRSSPSFAIGGVRERPRFRYYVGTPPSWGLYDRACRITPEQAAEAREDFRRSFPEIARFYGVPNERD